MTPIEQAIRAVCQALGADPETWRGFEEISRVALKAFADALPPEIGDAIRAHLENPQ